MTKFAGLSVVVNVDNTAGSPVNVSNDVSSISSNGSIGEQVVTGLDKTAEERIQLVEDVEYVLAGRGVASAATRAVLWENLRTTRTVTIDLPDSATVAAEVFFYGFQWGRADDGAFTWSTTMRLNNGTAPAWS
jgi:hypothetical protein